MSTQRLQSCCTPLYQLNYWEAPRIHSCFPLSMPDIDSFVCVIRWIYIRTVWLGEGVDLGHSATFVIDGSNKIGLPARFGLLK